MTEFSFNLTIKGKAKEQWGLYHLVSIDRIHFPMDLKKGGKPLLTGFHIDRNNVGSSYSYSSTKKILFLCSNRKKTSVKTLGFV